MAIVLRGDNRILTAGMPYTFLTTNYASGVSTFIVSNTNNFAQNDYVLIQEIGQEQCEILKISTVTAATGTITTSTASRFAHPESSRMIKIPYNQVRFFWTATDTFDESTPVTAYSAITPDSWFSQAEDTTHTTGYGWFKFKNETTAVESGNSNPIPYANFGRNTVKSILDGFFSSINNNDLQHISMDDAMEWLNEGHDEVKDALGMVNSSLDASDGTDTVTLAAGTREYSLASNCGQILKVFLGTDGRMVEPISITEVDQNDSSYYGTPEMRYYRRGTMIGFVPTPTESDTVNYRFIKTATDLNSYDDVVTLPKKGFNILKDYMLYRAKDKLKQADAFKYYDMFNNKLERLVVRSVNDDGSMDSWGIVSMT